MIFILLFCFYDRSFISFHSFIVQVDVLVGSYYEPSLLPDYDPCDFQLKLDKLQQHEVYDTEKKLIPAWDNLRQLRPGTLVMCIVSLHCYNIQVERNDPSMGFRRVRVFQTMLLFVI